MSGTISGRKRKSTSGSSRDSVGQDAQVRLLQRALERQGVKVRRENLARGPAFRVKSGDCTYIGEKFVFVDRRLSPDQQFTVLVDYLETFAAPLTEDELAKFPVSTQDMLRSRTPSWAEGEQLMAEQV